MAQKYGALHTEHEELNTQVTCYQEGCLVLHWLQITKGSLGWQPVARLPQPCSFAHHPFERDKCRQSLGEARYKGVQKPVPLYRASPRLWLHFSLPRRWYAGK